MNNDELGTLSKTVVKFGKPKGKFYMKSFDEIALRDLDWLLGQSWLRDPIRSKLELYLSKTPIQRALEKEGI